MKILITGATGLIGKEVVKACRNKNIAINYLTTSREKIEDKEGVKGFFWNPNAGVIDSNCFSNVTTIIHLAGASIAKRWTPSYKQKIVESRTLSTSLLFNSLKKLSNHSVKHVIAASAIGVYPTSLTAYYNENDNEIDDSFLGEVVEKWEKSVDNFEMLGIPVTKIRTGLVLTSKGGMLEPLVKTVKYYMGAPLASGKQWQSWIHLEDMVNIYLHVMEHKCFGVFNAVAPNPVTNEKMTKEIGVIMDKPVWPFHVPKFMLKLVLGEMSYLLYASQRVDSKKIEAQDFTFKYPQLKPALKNLLIHKSIF
ncbi:hypothetical protein SAMN05216480_101871 [Pustulibacterium marinum]|uniref:TIGR01777 family protein n=1 Tax=Pustulibacterium marinum TaxID=1224947 RepID=A0A1I7FD20_9FLAO|nr:TIGR01777 family oxidoreductase [Pustulibacterium marinum]SFU34100.1 hypothetical protein SAMN05216480_101871 [Pustulibacterium marinum]